MNRQNCNSLYAKIYMAGNIDIAKQSCRKFCYEKGLCINIYQTNYIYTGGEEVGFCIESINYPRFPVEEKELFDTMIDLGMIVMQDCSQLSFTVMSNNNCINFSRKDEIKR